MSPRLLLDPFYSDYLYEIAYYVCFKMMLKIKSTPRMQLVGATVTDILPSWAFESLITVKARN